MIEYELTLADRTLTYRIDTDHAAAVDDASPPEWTKLDNHKCSNCPLSSAEHSHCPPAVGLRKIMDDFKGVNSFDRMEVKVTTDERVCSKESDVQQGLRSLLGLVMATSACPHLSRLRPMARFHLPFSSKEETVFRTVGAYLIQQCLIARDGGEPDLALDGLRALYADLTTINRAFSQRVKSVSEADATPNAVVVLFSLAMLVGGTLDEDLERFRGLYPA